jgi:membrane protein YqaA with SNARE-associated domain
MQGFLSSIFSIFLSPVGLVALAVLDSSMLFFLPAAVDTAIVILVASQREFFWVFSILATAGSLAGAYITFQIGAKIGEASLSCWVPERRLKSIQKKVKDKGAVALAIPGLMPPPFPLTPFILACGALKVSRSKFFLTLAGARLLRFGTASVLALIYGRQIIGVIESDLFQALVSCFILVAIAGTAYSGYRLVEGSRAYRRRKPARSPKAA